MDQNQVKIGGMKMFNRVTEGFHHTVIRAIRGPDFTRDEKLFSGNSGMLDGMANRTGVVIDLGRIKLSISQLNG